MSSATFTYLTVVSGGAGFVAYDNTPPTITPGIAVPVSLISPTTINQPFTVYDYGGVDTSAITNLTPSMGYITNLNQVDIRNVSFDYVVSATGTIGLSAYDLAGNTSTSSFAGYQIVTSAIDTSSPAITFSNQNPITRTIINSNNEGFGSVHVKVVDYKGSLAPIPDNFILLNDSVGEIDYSSLNQTTYPTTVEFDIINISASGNIYLSAKDDFGNSNQAKDGKWIVGCEDNNRLINLVDYLPGHLVESDIFEFTKFFQDFLNTLYEDKECYIGILEKIQRLADLNNPAEMDLEYIQFFANKLGYNVDLTAGDLGTFQFGRTVETSTSASSEDVGKYLRFVVENLPNWYEIKTTRNAVKIMLFSFGIIGDIAYQWTNDYKRNWLAEINDNANVQDVFPPEYYPTSHFMLTVNLGETAPAWINNIDEVIRAINSIRPINTVFDQILGFFKVEVEPIGVNLLHRTQLVFSVPWANDAPATSSSNMVSIVP